MKKFYLKSVVILFLIINFFSGFSSKAQNATAFRKNYDLTTFDYPGNIIEGLTPNTYILGGYNTQNWGIISQLNDTGSVVWAYSYSDTSIAFQLNDIKKDAINNQYFACGGSDSNAAVFIVIDDVGTIAISKKFNLIEADAAFFNKVIKASDGGYVAVGYITGFDPDGAGPEIYYDTINYINNNNDTIIDYISSPVIVKLDSTGNHIWHKVFRYYVAATKDPITERIYNDASFRDVVEVSDGYVIVGSYDVNQHRSATDPNGDDGTPTDALILKVTTGGAITYHKQIDNPSTSTSQTSKYLSAINTTSGGDIIAGGADDNRELIQQFSGSGGFSNTFSRLFRYSQTFFVNDPTDVTQIYELNGSTDIITMTKYVKPLSFFANAIHRINSTATSNIWAKHYDFNGESFFPRGSLTSDGGYISASMISNGNYDFHVIKTDSNGDTPLSGCPPSSFTPTAQAGPTTFADPFYNSWSGTPDSSVILITRTSIALAASVVCTNNISFSIAGTIYKNDSSTQITNGKVYLIDYDTAIIQFTFLDSLILNGTNGNYIFSNVIAGEYLILAKPNLSNYPNIIPTYYGDTAFWKGATILNVNSDTTGVNISVREVPAISGSGFIFGYIQYGIGTGKTGNGNVTPFGDPVPGIDISLDEIPGGIKAHTETSDSGFYSFSNLPLNSTFKLLVDIPGLPMDSTYTVSITSTDTVFNNLDFVVDTTSNGAGGIYIGYPLSTKEFKIQELGFRIYPNPNDGTFTIEFPHRSSVKIYNVLGEIAYAATLQTTTTNYQLKIPDGIYNVRIENEKGIFNRKIVID